MSNVSPPEFVRTLLTKFLEPPMDADKIKSKKRVDRINRIYKIF